MYNTVMKVIEMSSRTIQTASLTQSSGEQLERVVERGEVMLALSVQCGEFIRISLQYLIGMNQLDKIRNAFAKKGHRAKALINQHQFLELLNDLRGRPFDQEVAMEIWQQASLNSHQEATVDELCSIIDEAQNILNDKLTEVEETIQELLAEKREIESGSMAPQQRSAELQRINIQIEEVTKDKGEYEQDLLLVTQPFGIDPKANRQTHRPTGLPRAGETRRSRLPSQQNAELQQLFYAVLVMALIEVIVIYKKYDFLNLLVLVTAMSVFLLNYFDNTYLKLCGGLAGVSVAADFTWLIMYGGSFWSPSVLSEHSSAQSGYLKLIVLLTLVNIAAKVYLVYLILKQGNVEAERDFTINPFEGVTVNVSADHGNLITRSCKGGAGGFL